MKPKKRFAKSFYEKRSLQTPRQEWWPSNAGELKELLQDGGDAPLLLLGDGQHLLDAVIGERGFDVVRTSHCKQVLSVDRESKIARVESGISWGTFQEEMTERGLSLERYRLYPQNSTIGGLLARHNSVGKELWGGDIQTGCIALSSATPELSKYRYTAAPRKASGPDSRYLFIGGEGLFGAILDVTLVVWKPSDARLFSWEASASDAVEIYRNIHDLGVRISWAHYADNQLTVAVHAHERILKGIEREFKLHLPGFETAGRAEVSSQRKKLEASHPDRRELATSKRTLAVQFSLEHLGEAVEELGDIAERIEIWDWSRRRARMYLRFPKQASGMELPANSATHALEWGPLINDQPVHWPHWVQSLKIELDPQRRLATGP